MAYSLTNTVRALLDRAAVARATIADAIWTSTQQSVTPIDLSTALYTRGAYQVRLKYAGTLPGAGQTNPLTLVCLVSDSTPGGAAAALTNVVGSHIIHNSSTDQVFIGLWERVPASGRYVYFMSAPNSGGTGAWYYTLDAEAVGVP